MNTRYYMVIIKGEIKTSEIMSCGYNRNTQKWDVKFNTGKIYSYAYLNVEKLTEPEVLNPNMYRISREGREFFDVKDNLWKEPYDVLVEYPVILSTTFSSRNSLNSDVVYDYLIMDEASQVDIATGALALSCARNENCKEMRAHEIIDTFQEHKVSSYFQRELNMTGRNPEAVYDILFKGTDFSIFTRDTVDFYEDVLSGFLVSYVDGFREKGKRDDIEKKIRILETYVNSITEDYVRNILEKRLFLCKGRFSRWDVNKVKAEYSYKDKCFLNVQIEKYGSNHLNDVLYTVYLLNISELLPEILISISSCFTKAIRNSKEQFAKEIIDSQVIVDMIILKSFIFYSDEIKKDEKLINAYEDILLALTEIRNEKAAVLLDEFRIH